MTSTDFCPEQYAEEAKKLSQIQPLLIGLVKPSPTNPRKHFPENQHAELTESVKRHGILQPILVRDWPIDQPWDGDLMPSYEIVAGERRYRAAQAAGLRSIPGMIRTLTDLEVLEIQIIENLQRQDLHPLEEAEGYERMMKHHGYTADQLAEKIGKSKAYIYARLKLTALSEDGKRLFYGGLLNPSTALLVARIPTLKLQDQAIKDITTPRYGNEPMSVRAAKEHIRDRYTLRLADAPFPHGDRDLVPTAGRCFDCQHRTGNQPELFSDIDSADVCTNPDCFSAKKMAYVAIQAAEAKAKGHEVITGKKAEEIAPYGVGPHSGMKKGFVALDAHCYDDSKNRTYRELLGEDAPITLVEDVRKNTLVPVIEEKVLAAKLKEAGITTSRQKEKDINAKNEAKAKLENEYRARLFSNIRVEAENLMTHNGPESIEVEEYLLMIRTMAEFFFMGSYDDLRKKLAKLWDAEGKNDTERVEAFRLRFETMDARDCWRLLIDILVIGQVTVNAWSMQSDPERLLVLAKVLGIDPADIRADVEEEFKAAKASEKGAKKASPPKTAAQAQTQSADQTGTETVAGEMKPNKAKAKSGKSIIERNEKPTETEPSEAAA
ncbi:MAG: ParB/RepB/Spo0J family partition domain protein [Proteobacteria bacterium]|nr:ParB/RepB/Spo0J family partition domain protein [Pseudomonadota bacterium]